MRRLAYCIAFLVLLAFALLPKATVNSQTAVSTQEATMAATQNPFPGPHSYLMVSTNFPLEPLLDDYAKLYPNIDFSTYQVVFKSQNEWPDTPYTYIVVFSPPPKYQYGLHFWDYVDAWIKLHPGNKAAASAVSNVLPRLNRQLQPSGVQFLGF